MHACYCVIDSNSAQRSVLERYLSDAKIMQNPVPVYSAYTNCCWVIRTGGCVEVYVVGCLGGASGLRRVDADCVSNLGRVDAEGASGLGHVQLDGVGGVGSS